ncbi:MAG: Nif3-like dinuclear metal center hexameric protein [Planctomycetota bacterium]
MSAPTLDEVLDLMHEIAPLELAADWDNVGLLLRSDAKRDAVARCLLTIDLTDAVVAEAEAYSADLVISYHPPIFRPMARLDVGDATQRRILAAVRAGYAVYSPHTALDAAAGGLADWLLDCALGEHVPSSVTACGEGEYGRVAQCSEPMSWQDLLQRLKQRFSVPHLQIARPDAAGDAVHSVAVAAGAGSGVLRGAAADVWVTGEMSHHDALAAVAAGTSVILAGHSNTERGYLSRLAERLREEFSDGLDVAVAERDRDPLTVV